MTRNRRRIAEKVKPVPHRFHYSSGLAGSEFIRKLNWYSALDKAQVGRKKWIKLDPQVAKERLLNDLKARGKVKCTY